MHTRWHRRAQPNERGNGDGKEGQGDNGHQARIVSNQVRDRDSQSRQGLVNGVVRGVMGLVQRSRACQASTADSEIAGSSEEFEGEDRSEHGHERREKSRVGGM